MAWILRGAAYLFLLAMAVMSLMLWIGQALSEGLIAYTWTDDSHNPHVMLMDSLTRLQMEVTYDTGDGFLYGRAPQWSPDGQRLSFSTFRNRRDIAIYEALLQPYRLTNLTSASALGSVPLYSTVPDRFALLERLVGQAPRLLLYEGGVSTVLSPLVQGIPQWSTDGRYLAYLARLVPDNEAGIAATSGLSAPQIDIFIYDADTQTSQNYTADISAYGNPMWSPDGSQIAFEGHELDLGTLFILELATGDIWQSDEQIAIRGLPQWSPDGRFIAFTNIQQGNLEIFLLDTASKHLQNLAEHPAYDIQPSWSANGRFVAFISRRAGQDEVYTVDIQSKAIRRLTFSPENESDPVWRPNP